MPTVNVDYMVDDVEAAVAFYTTHLGFTLLSKTLSSLCRRRSCGADLQDPGPDR